MFQWMNSSRKTAHDGATDAVRQGLISLMNLTMLVEARDPYTAGHMWRVSRFSRLLAEHGGLSPRDQALCELGGFVHDLGKIAIPDSILTGTSRLSDEQFAIMKTHPGVGAHLTDMQPLGALVHDAVRSHHERPDGLGYPDGLAGEAIPQTAAVIGLADAFDAMTSDRSYRKGMGSETALAIVADGQGSQFDPHWASILLDAVPSLEIEHVIGHSADGIPLEVCPMCHGPLARPTDPTESVLPCRICGAELDERDGEIVPTGRMAAADALQPRADRALIHALTERMLSHVH